MDLSYNILLYNLNEHLTGELKAKFNLEETVFTELRQEAGDIPAELFMKTYKGANHKQGKKYSFMIRKFALNLHLHSVRAYR